MKCLVLGIMISFVVGICLILFCVIFRVLRCLLRKELGINWFFFLKKMRFGVLILVNVEKIGFLSILMIYFGIIM